MRTTALLIGILIFIFSCQERAHKKEITTVNVEHIEVRKLAHNHWQTYTDIVIDAPIEEVWEVLTDWNKYPNWSSSLTMIKGDIQDKGKVRVSYLVDGNTFETPHIFIYKELEEFGWSDAMTESFEGLTDNHRFRVEKISDSQTRFIQSDDFKGEGNKDMTAEKVANITVTFFPTLNRELKAEVESMQH